jgi:hypothetical protein
MDASEIHDIAAERALDYTNTVTFSRNATVFEDMNRNLVPFISSYRQFGVYWMRAFAKNPLALSAAYKYDPTKDKKFFNLKWAGINYSVPAGAMKPFWMQQDFTDPSRGFGPVLKQAAPSSNPLIGAMVLAPLADWLAPESDLTNTPGLTSTDPSFAPLSRVGNVWYAVSGQQFPLSRPITTFQKRKLDFARGTVHAENVNRGDLGPTVAVHDDPWWKRFADAVHISDAPVLFSEISRFVSILGAVTATPQESSDLKKWQSEFFVITDPIKQAVYRSQHLRFDDYLKLHEHPTNHERNEILKRWPEGVAYEPPSTQTIDGHEATWTQDDYAQLIGRSVQYTTPKQYDAMYVDAYVKSMGGRFDKGDKPSVYYPGDISRESALARLQKNLKRADRLVKQAATDLSDGNPRKKKSLLYKWKDSLDTKSADGMWSVHSQLADWAITHGYDPLELSTGAQTEFFESADKQGFISDKYPQYQTPGPSKDQLTLVDNLYKVGLIRESHRDLLLNGSPYDDQAMVASLEVDVKNRKALLHVREQETFKLDSKTMNTLGYPVGPGWDKAMEKVELFYYQPGGYDWCKNSKLEHYGAQGANTRDARNAYYAYRDKVFSKVKGGEAVTGGLAKTILKDPYFTGKGFVTFGSGKSGVAEQKGWQKFLTETLKPHPNEKLIDEMYTHFTQHQKDKYHDRQRVVDYVYVAAKASIVRNEMKSAYSDYYGGPGNSVYTTMGQKKVKELERLIKSMYTDSDGETLKTSSFYKDVLLYFKDAHGFAYSMLEWYYH